MKVIKWISYEEAIKMPNSGIGGSGGWFQHRMRWRHYLEKFTVEGLPYVEALRASIIEQGLKYTGHEHQNEPDGVPVFETGEVATYTFRAWGDLMAAVWSTEEEKDYNYMDFYC